MKHFTSNARKKIKATSVNEISEELKIIRSLTYCTECGHRLSRIGGNTQTDKWDCRNPECSRFNYRLTDNMIKDILLHILNAVIANPDLLDTDSEISGYTPNIKVKCQQNEINRSMDNPEIDEGTDFRQRTIEHNNNKDRSPAAEKYGIP